MTNAGYERKIARLEKRVADLEALVLKQSAIIETQATYIKVLERRLGINSSNSHQPPSTDDDKARSGRGKDGKSNSKKKKKRKGVTKALIPTEDCDSVVPVSPCACERCNHALGVIDSGDVVRHQVTEIPPVVATVTEYQLHAGSCQRCGHKTRAKAPYGEAVYGPGVVSFIGELTGIYRLSKRLMEQLLASRFGIKLCVATVIAQEERLSMALKTHYEGILAKVRGSPVMYVDETGWYDKHKRSWLWGASTPEAVVFRIDKRRNQAAAKAIIGEDYEGIVVSDRHGAYIYRPLDKRQSCLAHILRDYTSLAGSDDPVAMHVGEVGEAVSRLVMSLWKKRKDGLIADADFSLAIDEAKSRLAKALKQGMQAADEHTQRTCKKIWSVWPSYWTCVDHPDVEPTNNRAERNVRPAVIKRKLSFGTQSERGARFIETILSVTMTLRLQGKNVSNTLREIAENFMAGKPQTPLFPA